MPNGLSSWAWLRGSSPIKPCCRSRPKRPGELAAKPAGALQASKRLMKRAVREQIKAAMKAENEEFSRQVRSDEAREALTSFLEKRRPKAA